MLLIHQKFSRALLVPACVLCTTSGAVYAQSSTIQLYGSLDVGVTSLNHSSSGNTRIDSGVIQPTYFGFRGNEDLGQGISALFLLEQQFQLNNGQALIPGTAFSRQSYVGLRANQWGALTLGNQMDFMTDSLALRMLDASLFVGIYNFRQGPFSKLGIPDNPTGSFDFDRMAGEQVANSVKYVTPTIAGFSLGGMYGFGEQSANKARTYSLGANYNYGGLGIGVAYTDMRYPSMNDGRDGIVNFGAGAKYAFGNHAINLLYTNTRNTLTTGRVQVLQAGWRYQITSPLSSVLAYEYMYGNTELNNNRAHQVSAMLDYALSKRTDVYVETLYQKASGDGDVNAWMNALPEATQDSQVAFRIGMRYNF